MHIENPNNHLFNPREADHLLREEIGKLKGKVDLLVYGACDPMPANEKQNFYETLQAQVNNFYELIHSNIIAKVRLELESVHLEMEHTQRDIIYRLTEVAEIRSKETGNHVKRVANYCRLLAQYMSLSREDVESIYLASPMHDIGKITIPDGILNKPGKLLPEERTRMQEHTISGHDILAESSRSLLKTAAEIALSHHERWDGEGYPKKLKKKEVPLFGRICAVADVFDALASERAYKKAWPIDRVLDYIAENREKQFDPEIVDILLANSQEFIEIGQKFSDSF